MIHVGNQDVELASVKEAKAAEELAQKKWDEALESLNNAEKLVNSGGVPSKENGAFAQAKQAIKETRTEQSWKKWLIGGSLIFLFLFILVYLILKRYKILLLVNCICLLITLILKLLG